MNVENIQSYLKQSFFEDEIQKEDILKKNTEELKESFTQYIHQLCISVYFFEYCKNIILKGDDENIEDIKKEMEYENISVEERNELDIVYDWFFIDRVNFFLKEDINFFIDLVEGDYSSEDTLDFYES